MQNISNQEMQKYDESYKEEIYSNEKIKKEIGNETSQNETINYKELKEIPYQNIFSEFNNKEDVLHKKTLIDDDARSVKSNISMSSDIKEIFINNTQKPSKKPSFF
jgi:hypothetical protein